MQTPAFTCSSEPLYTFNGFMIYSTWSYRTLVLIVALLFNPLFCNHFCNLLRSAVLWRVNTQVSFFNIDWLLYHFQFILKDRYVAFVNQLVLGRGRTLLWRYLELIVWGTKVVHSCITLGTLFEIFTCVAEMTVYYLEKANEKSSFLLLCMLCAVLR